MTGPLLFLNGMAFIFHVFCANKLFFFCLYHLKLNKIILS